MVLPSHRDAMVVTGDEFLTLQLPEGKTASTLEEKLDDYAAAGTRLVWVVDPVRRTVMVIATDAPVRWLREGDALDGGETVTGFSCAVADIFEGIAR